MKAEATTTENTAAVAEQGATVAPGNASSKKHSLKIESTKTEAGDRVYQIKK
jgi:hypothetical protein